MRKSPCETCSAREGCEIECLIWNRWFRREWRLLRNIFLKGDKGHGKKF